MKIARDSESQFPLSMLETISSIIVKQYIGDRRIDPEDYDDFTQTLKTRYLASKDRIEAKFRGDSQPQTYMSAVLNNMLREEIRTYDRHKQRSDEFEKVAMQSGETDNSISPEDRAIIENEKKNLRRVFLTLGKNRAKVLLCCKMVFRLKVTDEDLDEYLNGRPSNGAEKFIEVSDSDQNQDIYQKLCQVTNLVEGKDNKSDAIRLWLSKQIDQIITRLNSNGISKYNLETFGILLEETYY